MTSYIPELVYGDIRDTDGYYSGHKGLVPWPAHLRPREAPSDIELTKKGEAYCASNAPLPEVDLHELFGEGQPRILASAGGVFFLTLTRDRASIAYTIERLINMLDAMDGDSDDEQEPDLEDAGDERDQSWPEFRGTAQMGSYASPYEDVEEDDEAEEGGDDEFTLGWSEADSLTGHLTAGAYGMKDGEIEPELGWTGIAMGWREGEPTDDREGDDEKELNGDEHDYSGTEDEAPGPLFASGVQSRRVRQIDETVIPQIDVLALNRTVMSSGHSTCRDPGGLITLEIALPVIPAPRVDGTPQSWRED